MSQPSKIVISVSFAGDEANGVGGRSTLRTAALDALAAACKTTLDQIIDNLALIQRDDGALLDGTVRTWTLGSDVLALLSSATFKVRGAWMTATAYALGDLVLSGGIVYACMVAHTSSGFSADLGAGDWGPITATQTATSTPFSPTSTISSTNAQAAIAELDRETRPGQSILFRELFNGL